MKVIAVIPAHNEDKSIAQIIQSAKLYVDKVIVVDDGSTDHTTKTAHDAGAETVWLWPRRGAGAATKLGLHMSMTYSPDIVVTLDGDGQHDPTYIPELIRPIENGDAGVAVIGSRFLDNSYKDIMSEWYMPGYRRLGIDIINWLCNIGARDKVSDTQCCFRAYGYGEAKWLSEDMSEDGFGFSVESLLKMRLFGIRIAEVPVHCRYRNLGEDSTLPPLKHGLQVASSVVKWRLKLGV